MKYEYAIDRKDIMDEWDWVLNNKNGIFPNEISYGSSKKIYLICPKKHKYTIRASHRFNNHRCPYCANQKVLVGFNDLESIFPDLTKEWDYERNMQKPSDVLYGSSRVVWWKCSKGHSWKSSIVNRKKGTGCPYCSNKKLLVGFNDFKTLNPGLSEEWNFEKNVLKPEDYINNSHKKVWWKCRKCNYEWKTSIDSRCRGTGCVFCSEEDRKENFNNTIIERSGNLVDNKNKFLLQEWNYDKNKILPQNLSIHSGKKVWWKCSFCSYEWENTIDARVNGRGCPNCSKESKTSFPEQAIFYYIKKIYANAVNGYKDTKLNISEIDIYIPDIKVGIEYDGMHWHKNSKKDIKKDKIVRETQIILYRIKEIPEDKLYIENNNIYYNPKNDSNLSKMIYFLFQKIFRKIMDVDIKRDRSNIYENYIVSKKENSLQKVYPKLSLEWDYEKNGNLLPNNFASHSNKKVWWKCSKGHSYEASINNRANGTGCPYCNNHKVLVGFNDLKTICPNLVKEWDYEKNGNLLPNNFASHSNKKVWWKCSKGHSYEAIINNRRKGTGCPYCSNKKILKGYNDLETRYPKLIKEWNYEKNIVMPSSVSFHSSKKVWWKCSKCDFVWQTSVEKRTKRLQGCPNCHNNPLKSLYF